MISDHKEDSSSTGRERLQSNHKRPWPFHESDESFELVSQPWLVEVWVWGRKQQPPCCWQVELLVAADSFSLWAEGPETFPAAFHCVVPVVCLFAWKQQIAVW